MSRPHNAVICLVLLAVAILAGQAQQFEVASIRPSDTGGFGPDIGVRMTATQVRIRGLSLKDYIGIAYELDPPQVIAPEWAGQQRFDIAANMPEGATREQMPRMMRTLLAERFELKVHKESREFPVYALTVGKGGLKIKGTPIDPNAPPPVVTEAAGTGSDAGVVINMAGGTFSLVPNKLEVRQMTMDGLARALTRFAERKTIDATALTDRFDFSLDLSPEDYRFALMRAAINNGYPLPPQALRLLDSAPSNVLGQYIAKTGLTLEERKAPLDVVVVDSVSRTPTDN